MLYTYILRIETEDKKVVLASPNAEQEVFQKIPGELQRNINSEILKNQKESKIKVIVKTKDSPDLSLIKIGAIYNVYSAIRFKTSKDSEISCNYVEETVDRDHGYFYFQPIWKMALSNYSCKSTADRNQNWTFEFEEAGN